MKVVIDIPEERYEWIKNNTGVTDYPTTKKIYESVRNGIPIQEGHGRLIDESDIIWAKFRVESKYFGYDEVVNWIDICNAPTIIPADKETEE